MAELEALRHQSYELRALLHAGDRTPATIGRILDRGWQLKRGLASGVTSSEIDEWYQKARDGGALGGKLCGAGGGGFLMFLVEPRCQDSVRAALGDLKEVSVHHEVHGSQIMLQVE
jgi:D-glycero-alpha-D-manno-heptose-7-phosphate kinase